LDNIPLLSLRPCTSSSKLSILRVVPTVQPFNTASNTPSSGKRTLNGCHRIENASCFALGSIELCKRGIATGKFIIYTIDGLKNCAKNDCNTMKTAPRRHKDHSSGANRPSDIAVTVNIDAEFNLMAVNPRIEPFEKGSRPRVLPQFRV